MATALPTYPCIVCLNEVQSGRHLGAKVVDKKARLSEKRLSGTVRTMYYKQYGRPTT